jgi:hypothetical protein
MTVNKSKRIFSWWINTDIEIACVCGMYIQIGDRDSGTITCKECGQKYEYTEFQVAIIEDEE